MILRRFLINFLFVIIGCLMGWLTAQYMRNNLNASPLMCIVTIFFFLVIFIVIAQILIMKITRLGSQLPLQLIHHGEILGWIVPRNEPTKAGYPLNKERITIGRDIKNDILLNDKSISREHVEVLKTQEGHLIRDLDSKNGLFINNMRVKEHLLQQGDIITIGDLEFFYRSTNKDKLENP